MKTSVMTNKIAKKPRHRTLEEALRELTNTKEENEKLKCLVRDIMNILEKSLL